MSKIKFCGLTRRADIEAVNSLAPDYIGFVFAPQSKRYLPREEAAKLRKLLVTKAQVVGVFVNEPLENIIDLLEAGIIDQVQLHGQETEAYLQELRQRTKAIIIQAFTIGNSQDVEQAQASSADYILLDTGAGTGRVFDWQLVQQVQREFFLAGGLSEANITDAIEQLQPYAVDISSGIETAGIKDQKKMARIIAQVRRDEEL